MPEAKRTYTQKDILALTYMSLSRWEMWARAGLLSYGGGGEGRGVQRKFDFLQVVQIAVLNRLADQGVKSTAHLRWVREALEHLDHQSYYLSPDKAEIQQEQARWKAFKSRSDKAASFAALMVRSVSETNAIAVFVDSGAQVEEQFIRYELIGDERVPIHGAIGAAWMVIELGRLVAELERETGDRLV
jgi:hypothetical protein